MSNIIRPRVFPGCTFASMSESKAPQISKERLELARRLKESRIGRHLEQKEVVAKLVQDHGIEIKIKAFYHWETGTSMPNLLQMRALCELYQTTADAILFDKPNWQFPLVKRDLYEALDLGQKGYVQHAMNNAIKELTGVGERPLGAPIAEEHQQELARRARQAEELHDRQEPKKRSSTAKR